MAGEGTSDLPLHYGGKTTSGELVHRPISPLSPTSPRQTYQAFNRAGPYEADHHYVSDGEGPRAGLRRRPSSATAAGLPPRRHSHGDYDGERPSFNSKESQQRLRDRERSRDDYYRDRDDDRDYYYRRDRDDGRHPDQSERSRPPRAYRNYERGGSQPKNEIEETRSDWRDLEKGNRSPERFGNGRAWRHDDELSIDGYNYEGTQHRGNKAIDFKSLTPEERAEVLRLPWTQWMHSDVKNRKYLL